MFFRQKIQFAFTLLVFSSGPALAYETDNFTDREIILAKPDATTAINSAAQKRIQQALTNFNLETGNCSADLELPEPTIIQKVAEQLSGPFDLSIESAKVWHFSTQLERELTLDPRFEKYRHWIQPEDSIYAGWAFISKFKMQAAVRIGNQVVGLDKIGHFFWEGLGYFREALSTHIGLGNSYRDFRPELLSRRDVTSAIRRGQSSESGLMGFWSSGVYSYGDLYANFQGFKFWLRLLKTESPYILCQNNHYQFNPNAPFDFSFYVSPAMDEAVNCSKYNVDAEQKNSAYSKIAKLGGCPIFSDPCQDIGSLNCAEYNVHPSCLAKSKTSNLKCTMGSSELTTSESWKMLLAKTKRIQELSRQIQASQNRSQGLPPEEIEKIRSWLNQL